MIIVIIMCCFVRIHFWNIELNFGPHHYSSSVAKNHCSLYKLITSRHGWGKKMEPDGSGLLWPNQYKLFTEASGLNV